MAQRFLPYRYDTTVVVFASGVSNSKEIDTEKFEREQNLLMDTLHYNMNGTFIYFSTCSIYDQALCATPYVLHKIKIEKVIQEHAKWFRIFRLPQVVGKGGNKRTLVNYLFDSIVSGVVFEVWRNAKRSILDIDDVFLIISAILNAGNRKNGIVNISLHQYSILEIVNAIERITGKVAKFSLVEKGASCTVETKEIQPIINSFHFRPGKQYLENVIEKYFGSARLQATVHK
jgi:nucleoside-diphosphate-sugar epimerase